jgi:hypothetical protein
VGRAELPRAAAPVSVDGRIIGHLAIMGDRPMPEPSLEIAVLRIFADRAAARARAHARPRGAREYEGPTPGGERVPAGGDPDPAQLRGDHRQRAAARSRRSRESSASRPRTRRCSSTGDGAARSSSRAPCTAAARGASARS